MLGVVRISVLGAIVELRAQPGEELLRVLQVLDDVEQQQVVVPADVENQLARRDPA